MIEDDDLLRRLYQRELEDHNISTDTFGTAGAGLKALKDNHYELVILDILLPDENGIEVLQEIKQDPQTKDIPVILLSNVAEEEIQNQGFKFGAEAYLIKANVTPLDIVEEVHSILNNKQP